MKIAIYDKWLSTLGGGEKVATVMAEILSKKGHKVDIVSNFDVDKKQVAEKMGVDLSRVNLVSWYERSFFRLTPMTEKYDLLINVSFLDHMPSLAKKSIYYIHFPTPMKTTILGFIKYDTVLPFLRKFLIIPEIQSGIDPIDDVFTRGGRWLSEQNTIVFSNISKAFDLNLRIYVDQLSLTSLKSVHFSSANANVRVLDSYIDHGFNVLVFKLNVSGKGVNPAIKVLIDGDTKTNGFGLVSLTIKDFRFILWNLLKRYMPRYEMALYGSSAYKPGSGLDTYDLFLSNSEFTKNWTHKYWGKGSQVLYPPIDIVKFKRAKKKKNIILNVGRFFIGGHSKKQEVLLSVFKKMVDQKMIDNSWELHFVGGVAGGREHTDYLNKIKEEAKGYAVYFHLFTPFDELKKLYSQARIYWHATGYGESENSNPIAFEHFGITVVEAMAAGVVPIVFKGGGLTETVDKESGFTWKTKSQLAQITSKISKNKKFFEKLSVGAEQRAKLFGKSVFESRFIQYIKDL